MVAVDRGRKNPLPQKSSKNGKMNKIQNIYEVKNMEKFVVKAGYIEAIDGIDSTETRDKLICAMVRYGICKTEPTNLQGTELALWKLLKVTIDRDIDIHLIRAEAGRKGGAGKGNQNARKKQTV